MTLILKLDLDMVKMYHHTKKFLCEGVQKLWSEQTDTQTDRRTDRHTDGQTDTTKNMTYPHSRVVIKSMGVNCNIVNLNLPDNLKSYK